MILSIYLKLLTSSDTHVLMIKLVMLFSCCVKNLMRKSSKEEKRLETEFKEQAKEKAELPKKEKEREKAGKGRGRGRPKSDYAKLISKLGKC